MITVQGAYPGGIPVRTLRFSFYLDYLCADIRLLGVSPSSAGLKRQ